MNLHGGAGLPDLVQEERPAVRQLEQPGQVGGGARDLRGVDGDVVLVLRGEDDGPGGQRLGEGGLLVALLLIGVMSAILQWGVEFGFESALPATRQVPGELGIPVLVVVSWTNQMVKLVALFLVTALTQTYGSICATLLYFDLRIRKEGYDLELAARQQVAETKPAL